MKEVYGWYLPDDDAHFTEYLTGLRKAGQAVEYQKAQRDAAISYCDNFRTAIDVGAHVGLWAGPLEEQFSTVHAFEPYSEFHKILKKNALHSTIHGYALSDQEGTARIIVNKENSGIAYIEECKYPEEGPIPMATLDSFGFENVDFIKVDCEGYELPVLKGAGSTIAHNRPVIIVEQKPKKSETYGWGQHDAITYLIREHNYRIIDRVIDDWILKPASRGGK